MAEVVFKKLECPVLNFSIQQEVEFISAGMFSDFVIYSGDLATYFTPGYNGRILPPVQKKKDCDEAFNSSLNEK